MLLGGASATIVGLLFVAAFVSACVFSPNRRGALSSSPPASCNSAASSRRAACLIVLATIQAWESVGG
jgi:hypothetical protein